MPPILAAALSVAVLAGVATWIFVSSGSLLLWAAFVAWGCFFHLGGDSAALKLQLRCNTFGVFIGTCTGIAIAWAPLPQFSGALWAGICIAVSVVLYILMSQVRLIPSIPAITYGYACTFAYLTQNPTAFTIREMTALNMKSAFIVVSVSMGIGALFAFCSARLAASLQGPVPRIAK